MSERSTRRLRFHATGQVQGVGFRPFVYRLASELGLAGWVANDSRGVVIEVQGQAEQLDEFARRLRSDAPALARIDELRTETLPPNGGEGPFEIRSSEPGQDANAQVTVDTAVCEQCLREMRDPAGRRYRYPFINCTHCGPRYTIVTGIPYDRPSTTMAGFAMCPDCAAEYENPRDRRFHAQPIACPRCGPRIWLADAAGKPLPGEPVAKAAELLADGRIVAIKGLGGFHLACRADDERAVGRLRRRKRRDAKPFAVMVADLKEVRRLCVTTPSAEEMLAGPLRPIVILPAQPVRLVSSAVTGGLDTLGVFLPYTPVHHLLFDCEGLRGLSLVMTSGNRSDEPIIKDNESAQAELGDIADAFLLHDRPIARRLDDSVALAAGDGRWMMLRRGRGYAPSRIEARGRQSVFGRAANGGNPPRIFAAGGELKSTVCLVSGGRAILSEHIGDLKDARTYRHYRDTVGHLETLYRFAPEAIVADLHPGYLSTQYALERQARSVGMPPVLRVQHHHAHVAACMAENGYAEPVIGLACDGTGYGSDGAIWGCEILLADLAEFRRLGHLRYLPMPGGDAAAEETCRPAIAALYDTFGPECLEMVRRVGLPVEPDTAKAVIEMIRSGANCPPSSSLGRWFDATAALCGLAQANRFEGQAPMLLEAAVEPAESRCYDVAVEQPPDGPFEIDLRPMVRQMVADRCSGVAVGKIAARFHNTVAVFLADAVRRAVRSTGVKVAALSGGCFANRRLSTHLAASLEQAGLTVLRHQTVPCNDACIALGQAAVASARLSAG